MCPSFPSSLFSGRLPPHELQETCPSLTLHRTPFVSWDSVGGGTLYNWFRVNKKKSRHKGWGDDRRVKSGTGDQGYCTHSSVLFPTWHRAYGAMIEQAIQATMVEIADSFVDGMMPGEQGPPGPDSLKWQSVQAALMFRQPYVQT